MDNIQRDKTGKTIEKRLWAIACFVFAVFFLFVLVLAYLSVRDYYSGELFGWRNLEILKKSNENQCENCIRRKIDGVLIKEEQAEMYPVAVIIENNIDARPPVALAEANLVYEAEAEGGITRYMAVYADGRDIGAIGPIRSARPYFVDWARELSAVLVHCGGSPEALAMLAQGEILNLNEFYDGDYFWRNEEILAPHNIFTSSENLYSYLTNKGLTDSMLLSWQYKGDLTLEKRPQTGEIIIGYKKPDFVVKWLYNRESNEYIRYLADEQHKDLSGQQITAKNIVIEYVEAEVIDDELRLKMNYIGSGEAFVCLDGACVKGSWQKSASAARTRFYDNQSKEIEFNAGTTWIEIVQPEREVLVDSQNY